MVARPLLGGGAGGRSPGFLFSEHHVLCSNQSPASPTVRTLQNPSPLSASNIRDLTIQNPTPKIQKSVTSHRPSEQCGKQKDRYGFAYHRLKPADAPMSRADHLQIAADAVRMFDEYLPN